MKLCIWPDYELREGLLRVYLTDFEGLLMTALLSHREVTRDLLADVLWPDVDDTPDWFHGCIGVHLCRLRQKLRAFGHDIGNRYGGIWWLVEPDEEKRLAA